MSVLFIIPVILDIHYHRLEVLTLVSEIHENVNLMSRHKEHISVRRQIDSKE